MTAAAKLLLLLSVAAVCNAVLVCPEIFKICSIKKAFVESFISALKGTTNSSAMAATSPMTEATTANAMTTAAMTSAATTAAAMTTAGSTMSTAAMMMSS